MKVRRLRKNNLQFRLQNIGFEAKDTFFEAKDTFNIRFALSRKTSFLRTVILCFFCINTFFAHAQDTMLYNNGVTIIVNDAGTLFSDGHLKNNSGILENDGVIIVKGDIINNDFIEASNNNPSFTLTGDWVNNDIFQSGNSDVILNGNDQFFKGIPTSFFNLTLENGNIKFQEVDINIDGVLNLDSSELATQQFVANVNNRDVNAIQRANGFVSSDLNGSLTRKMNNGLYLFPVGNRTIVGTSKLRPIILEASNASDQEYSVRLAWLDPTVEGFDIDQKSDSLCKLNEAFFHRIAAMQQSGPVTLRMFYEPTTDGEWQNIAYWESIVSPQWEKISNSGVVASTTDFDGVAFNEVASPEWIDFTDTAFVLSKTAPSYQLTATRDANCRIVTVNISVEDGLGSSIDSVEWLTGIPDELIVISETDSGKNITVQVDSNAVVDSVLLPFIVYEDNCSANDTITIFNQPFEPSFDTARITTCIIDSSGTFLDTLRTDLGCDSVYLTTIISLDIVLIRNRIVYDCSMPDTLVLIDTVEIDENCDSLIITRFECDSVDSFLINVPTAFTPNGDGENDTLKAYVNQEIDFFNMEIFDRWGEKVFASSSISSGWDGRFRGKSMNSGIYVAVVQAALGDVYKKVVQHLKLIR